VARQRQTHPRGDDVRVNYRRRSDRRTHGSDSDFLRIGDLRSDVRTVAVTDEKVAASRGADAREPIGDRIAPTKGRNRLDRDCFEHQVQVLDFGDTNS
jgi:hypothetical protein